MNQQQLDIRNATTLLAQTEQGRHALGRLADALPALLSLDLSGQRCAAILINGVFGDYAITALDAVARYKKPTLAPQ